MTKTSALDDFVMYLEDTPKLTLFGCPIKKHFKITTKRVKK